MPNHLGVAGDGVNADVEVVADDMERGCDLVEPCECMGGGQGRKVFGYKRQWNCSPGGNLHRWRQRVNWNAAKEQQEYEEGKRVGCVVVHYSKLGEVLWTVREKNGGRDGGRRRPGK